MITHVKDFSNSYHIFATFVIIYACGATICVAIALIAPSKASIDRVAKDHVVTRVYNFVLKQHELYKNVAQM